MIWLNNETAKSCSSETEQIFNAFSCSHKNASSPKKHVDEAESIIRDVIKGSEEQFYYVPSFYSQESLFANFLSVLKPISQEYGKNRILLPVTAEKSFINIFQQLQYQDFAYDWLVCNKDGSVEKQDFIEAISPRTLLFSLSLADGLLGTVFPLETLFSIIKERKILVHIDISHYMKYLEIKENITNQVDIVSFSGISLGGYIGSGGLFIRKSLLKYKHPFLYDEETGKWMHSLIGLNISLANEISCYRQYLAEYNLEMTNLKNHFEKTVIATIPEAKILFKKTSRLPNVSVVIFDKISAECLSYSLFLNRIVCNLGYNQFQSLSQALQGCGYPPQEAHCALSFAFDVTHDLLTVKTLVATLLQSIEKLKKQSLF